MQLPCDPGDGVGQVDDIFLQGLKAGLNIGVYVRAELAAEKGRISVKTPEKHPAGAEAHAYFCGTCGAAEAAPFQSNDFSAACEARIHFEALAARLKSCPDTSWPPG